MSLDFIPAPKRLPLFWLFCGLTVAFFAVFNWLDQSLRTSAAPSGIVSCELAGALKRQTPRSPRRVNLPVWMWLLGLVRAGKSAGVGGPSSQRDSTQLRTFPCFTSCSMALFRPRRNWLSGAPRLNLPCCLPGLFMRCLGGCSDKNRFFVTKKLLKVINVTIWKFFFLVRWELFSGRVGRVFQLEKR